jgi:hypothetical protein
MEPNPGQFYLSAETDIFYHRSVYLLWKKKMVPCKGPFSGILFPLTQNAFLFITFFCASEQPPLLQPVYIIRLPTTGMQYLTQVFNAVLLKGYFLAKWKVVQIILIPKLGKPPTS